MNTLNTINPPILRESMHGHWVLVLCIFPCTHTHTRVLLQSIAVTTCNQLLKIIIKCLKLQFMSNTPINSRPLTTRSRSLLLSSFIFYTDIFSCSRFRLFQFKHPIEHEFVSRLSNIKHILLLICFSVIAKPSEFQEAFI